MITPERAEDSAITSTLAGQFAYDLVRTLKLLLRLRDRAPRLTPGLEPASQPILHKLAHADAVRVSDLASELHADISTVSRSAASLVTAGLAEKTTDPADRRAQLLAITDAGRAAVASLNAQRAATFERILTDWTPADVRAFHAYLDRFAGDLERDLAASAP